MGRASPAEWANRLIWHLLIAPAIRSQHWSDRPAKRAGKAQSEGAKQQNGAEGRQRESLWGMQCGPFLITFCNDLVSFQIGVHRCLAPSVHSYTPTLVAPLESRGLRHSTPAKDLAPSFCQFLGQGPECLLVHLDGAHHNRATMQTGGSPNVNNPNNKQIQGINSG